MGKASGWTQERRDKASERMHRDKPWEKSTGPRTPEGKAVSSRNADKGGQRLRERIELVTEMSRAKHEMTALALSSRLVRPGGPTASDYETWFLEAQARYERASAAYRQLVGPEDLEHEAVAAAIMARLDAVPEGDDE